MVRTRTELEQEIRKHRKLYYNKQPVISDQEFDALVDELRAVDPDSKVLREVGAKPTGRKKVKHDHPMGSLDKCNTREELEKWLKSRSISSVVVQEKYDGASLEARYLGGKLIQLVTRGSGIQGQDVTHHCQHIEYLPKHITSTNKVYIRGEVIIHLSDFEAMNSELDEEEKAANPRNLAAGTLNSDEPMPERKLKFIACSVVGLDHQYELKDISFLAFNKFKPAKSMVVEDDFADGYFVDNIEDIRNMYIDEKRAKLDYMIDGLVIKANDKRDQQRLGYNRLDPKWAIAYKFPAEEAVTTLVDVEWNLSNTGIMAPRAVMAPVQLAGTTVKHAYLHNEEYIKERDIKIGDRVRIKKAGDIIPYIMSVESKGKSRRDIVCPDLCPQCECSLVQDGVFIVCDNSECPGKKLGVLKSYIKRLKIDLLGDSALDKFIEALKGGFDEPADLYKLSPQLAREIHGANGVKIVENIQKVKEIKLADLFAAMMVSGAGKTSFEELVANGLDTVDKLLNATVDQICQVPGFQETKAKKIVEGIKSRRLMIDNLLEYVTIVEPKKNEQLEGSLLGLTFMFTGAMSKSRDEMIAVVEANGGRAMSVKKGLSYLVAEDPNESSNKLEKARKLGIQVISEEQFWELVGARH